MLTLDRIHLKPGMHRSVCGFHSPELGGSCFGWTYERLGWQFQLGGIMPEWLSWVSPSCQRSRIVHTHMLSECCLLSDKNQVFMNLTQVARQGPEPRVLPRYWSCMAITLTRPLHSLRLHWERVNLIKKLNKPWRVRVRIDRREKLW